MHDHVRTDSGVVGALLSDVLAPLVIAVVAFAGTIGLRNTVLERAYALQTKGQLETSVIESPGPAALDLLSLEHSNGVADVIWLGMLGDIMRTFDADPVRVEQNTYVATDLDPRYELIYWAAALLLSSDLFEFKASDRVLMRGREALPDVARFPFLIAFNAYFGHGDAVRAAKFWKEASLIPGAPKYTAALASRALFHAGNESSAEQMLMEMIPLLPPSQQADAKIRLDVMRSEYRFRRYDEACEKFVADQGRHPATPGELQEKGYIDEPPIDLLDSPMEFDEGACVSRSELVFKREAEAAERVGMMREIAKKRFNDAQGTSDRRP
ncbi:MAG: hypothetical protein RIT81_36360 [Deltaproteobacteria bacterium]